jgi:hypothetical protein
MVHLGSLIEPMKTDELALHAFLLLFNLIFSYTMCYACYLLHSGLLLDLHIKPKEGGNMFL